MKSTVFTIANCLIALFLMHTDGLAEQNNTQLLEIINRLNRAESSLAQVREAWEKTKIELEDIRKNGAGKSKKNSDSLKIGGAVRMNFVHADYVSSGNQHRNGDFDFDIFRLDVTGEKDGILISAQIRFFQYMYALRHAWVGHAFDENRQLHIGIVPLVFGNIPYNSNNYFFSANYYLGLEDTQAAGIHWQHRGKTLDVDLGFYKNDDMGGIDGFVSNRKESYTYSIIGTDLNTTTNTPSNALAENDTTSLRIATKFFEGRKNNLEIGLSGLHGDIVSSTASVGKRYAYALHSVINVGNLNFKLQATKYKIDLDSKITKITVGAYAWNNQIASENDSYTANIAYTQKVDFGALKSLVFYNDYSHVTHKSGNLEETVMNVTGVALSAGAVYTYIDFINAKNMPFIGGDMAGDTKDWNQRFNINIGYYF